MYISLVMYIYYIYNVLVMYLRPWLDVTSTIIPVVVASQPSMLVYALVQAIGNTSGSVVNEKCSSGEWVPSTQFFSREKVAHPRVWLCSSTSGILKSYHSKFVIKWNFEADLNVLVGFSKTKKKWKF